MTSSQDGRGTGGTPSRLTILLVVGIPDGLAQSRAGGEHRQLLLWVGAGHDGGGHIVFDQGRFDPVDDAGEDCLDTVNRDLLRLDRLDQVVHAVNYILDNFVYCFFSSSFIRRGNFLF